MLREAPGSAPGLQGHAGATAASLRAPPACPYEPGWPCLPGRRRDRGTPAPSGPLHQRLLRGGPARRGARRAVGWPAGRRGLGGVSSPSRDRRRHGLCRRGVPRSPLRRCPGAEVGGVVGEFPFALHLKGQRTLPRSPNLLLEGYLEVPSWTTAAARPKTWKTTIPLRSAALGGSALSARPAGLRPHRPSVKTAQAPSLAFVIQGSCSPSSSNASGLPRALSSSHRRPSLRRYRVRTSLRTAVAAGRLSGHLFPWSRPPRPGQLGERAPGAPTGHAPTHACPGRSRPSACRRLAQPRTYTPAHSHSRTLAQAAWAADRRSSPAPPVRLRHGKPRLRLLALRSRGGLCSRRDPRHR